LFSFSKAEEDGREDRGEDGGDKDKKDRNGMEMGFLNHTTPTNRATIT